jgi:hypothetical protein
LRPEKWKDPAFATRPLAASRMLARAAVGPDMLLDGKRGGVREVSLDAWHVVSWSETVAAGKCTRVTVGGQGEGAGIDLRASDPGDGTEIDRCEAPHAASVRACAPSDASKSVRFDARASAGRLDGIVGVETSASP